MWGWQVCQRGFRFSHPRTWEGRESQIVTGDTPDTPTCRTNLSKMPIHHEQHLLVGNSATFAPNCWRHGRLERCKLDYGCFGKTYVRRSCWGQLVCRRFSFKYLVHWYWTRGCQHLKSAFLILPQKYMAQCVSWWGLRPWACDRQHGAGITP